ncbi:hypothetical protein [Streptomyces shenzhenensis]|uniref:hypothetical protein n=1 Tax=Streptomyces shenzhenensis TaxID=943815 RepID=UPI001F404857|nr:hypothetical protein [Streptomyces shenzhenensis]
MDKHAKPLGGEGFCGRDDTCGRAHQRRRDVGRDLGRGGAQPTCKPAEAAEQNRRADREREQERDERALQAKRDLYARLNTTARAYRIAARDAVLASGRGESVDPAVLDAAKEAWADQYSQAQMALGKSVLEVASTLNRSLGVGYTAVKQLPGSRDLGEAYQRAKEWFSGPLSDGVYLLRVTLRHDLGVEVDSHFDQTRTRILAALDSARDNLDRLLAAERAQAARSS